MAALAIRKMRYVQNAAGQQAFEDASREMAVGALAYDTTRWAASASSTRFLRSSRPWSPTKAE